MAEATLPKGYEPHEIEARWRKFWEDDQTFKADPDAPGEPFSIVIPPPNVTGALHIGHALNQTLQDVLCRHARQKGKNVLWVPGTDHAGIATQNVVERRLAQEGKSRHDLGREAFIERVWAWKDEYLAKIQSQIKAMGASVDWSRERFTMDDGLSRAVRQVFVRMYNDGLIYKGDYIVNWCTRCHTALSDDEVEHKEERGKLWHISYPLEDGSGAVVIATVRPETMFGDTAVAVHPEDERYQHLIGKRVRLPLTDRTIPIIADAYVEREFGTGALKVTPAHDTNDWRLGEKHKLEVLSVIGDNGIMNQHAGRFAGMSKEDARKAAVEALNADNLIVLEEELNHNVGHCYRCNTVVEPLVSTQWFVASTKLAPRARAAVPADTRIVPDAWLKTYYHWLDNIRDWCISRQIWWGHRIPAWNCRDCGELIVAVDAPTACACGSANLAQEEDVLDTWFSSALWPFTTMGWPDQTKELAKYYPTSTLVTAFDILFFWVARMIMMGQYIMDEVPFRDVYIHALVRDGEGKKMSKSTGNVIDPLEMIDKYGTDSLRFTLTVSAALGRDIRLSEERIEGNRHFVNKLWNAARFALMNLDGTPQATLPPANAENLHHTWILHRMEQLKAEVSASIEAYRFNDAAQGLYKFIWNEFCDWYLELIKPDMQAGGERAETTRAVLLTVLRETLVLLHPVMPFVTSEIWNALPGNENGNIARELYPATRPQCLRPEEAERMEMVQNVISAVRTIRAELNIAPGLKLTALIRPASESDQALLLAHETMIKTLARLDSFTVSPDVEAPKASASSVISGNEVIVPLSGAVDFDAEIARINKELTKLDKDLGQITRKLRNEAFVAKAPPEIVEKEREKEAELTDARKKLAALAERFKSAM